MKRKDLLTGTLTENKNADTVVLNTLKKDVKAISKAKRDVSDEIEASEEALEERLGNTIPLDKSVVEVMYSNLVDLKAKLALYESFEKEFLPKEEN